jgi:hypothetical protein
VVKGRRDATRSLRAHRPVNPIGCIGCFCGDAYGSFLEDGKVVTLAGEITEGDSDALKTIIRRANDSGHLIASARLNSPGGSILEGVKLADIIRYGKIATSVPAPHNALPLVSSCLLREAKNMQATLLQSAFMACRMNLGKKPLRQVPPP